MGSFYHNTVNCCIRVKTARRVTNKWSGRWKIKHSRPRLVHSRVYIFLLFYLQVRGEDEAMEVDEEGKDMDGDGQEEKDGEQEDMPDNLNLDNAEEVRNRIKAFVIKDSALRSS